MPIVAESFTHVIGVDTHARQHAYALIDAATGKLLEEQSFPTSPAGVSRALAWVHRRGGERVAVAVEGTGSYGATLTRALVAAGVAVFETRPPARGSRARDGKTDRFDALAAARSVLHADPAALAAPRADGVRAALRVRRMARSAMTAESVRAQLQLTALTRIHRLGVDARRPLGDRVIDEIAAWRPRATDPVEIAAARDTVIRLARRIRVLREELAANERQLRELVDQLAPRLLELHGVGPVSAAAILDVFSHRGRIRDEAAFAKIAGVAPIPVFSGNTGHHRLSRSGDRALNSALYRIVLTRLATDPATQTYRDQRIAQGKSKKAIIRSLKRYIARSIFRQLNASMA
jgi:transposase